MYKVHVNQNKGNISHDTKLLVVVTTGYYSNKYNYICLYRLYYYLFFNHNDKSTDIFHEGVEKAIQLFELCTTNQSLRTCVYDMSFLKQVINLVSQEVVPKLVGAHTYYEYLNFHTNTLEHN